jgi:exodeoxyribonuclease III
MKLISWNCQGAFRNKIESVLSFTPDIMVIQECEHPDKFLVTIKIPQPNQFLWKGENRNKGVGIFSYRNYNITILDIYNNTFKIVIPISAKIGSTEYIIFAICANNPDDKGAKYIEQVWKAIHFYENLITKKKNIILIGDFNSNSIWDRKNRIGNHSHVVNKLAENKIYSVYHKYFNQIQGQETQPTFYLYRKKEKPYHLDYCFVSEFIYKKLFYFEIGTFENWIHISDHSPIFLEWNDK